MPRGKIIFKSYVEHNVKVLYGTPYILIVEDDDDTLMHLYILDTEKKQYVSIQDWEKTERGSFDKWYEFALELQKTIVKNTYSAGGCDTSIADA